MDNPRKYARNLDEKELEKVIRKLNKAYRTGSEIVSDDDYDILIEELEKKNPNNSFLSEIGLPERDEIEKLPLPVWMGSMDKAKLDSSELRNFIKKYPGPYFLSAKLDGLSALISHDSFYTRGNGSEGQDISYLIDYLNLPILQKGTFVRGELIMKKRIFEKKYSEKFPKARSVVAGVINSKRPKIEILKDIDFIGYEYIREEDLSESEQFKELKSLGFKLPESMKLKTIEEDELPEILGEMKEKSPYEIDGVIITDDHPHKRNISGNPKYSVAFKMNTEGKKTKVIKVIWGASKYGNLIPRIQVEPIIIEGDTINYATAFNAKYIKNNSIGPGTELKITKSGDVIPYISEIIKSTKASFPKNLDYHWNENDVEIVLDDPDKNEDVILSRLVSFFQTLSIKMLL